MKKIKERFENTWDLNVKTIMRDIYTDMDLGMWIIKIQRAEKMMQQASHISSYVIAAAQNDTQ